MSRFLKELVSSESGASGVEYAILVSLIAAVIFGAVALLGQTVLKLFSSLAFP